ncbi:response regulator [Rhodovulum sp. P5]|uniref:response regulator n=1 Tax=Rhodovulum sp. P5 TaxID=1564506 RepID=UPI0015607517|nr:response regulator [Rhodovulum sp. P5]
MKVLIVEDDLEQANAYVKALEAHFDSCEVALTIEDATEKVTQRQFDLVVLDLFLPDGTSVALAHQIRLRNATTAILSVSVADPTEQVDFYPYVMSSDHFLRKPVPMGEFTARACYLASQRRRAPE